MINTGIEWCDDTLNLWWGCTSVSDGCSRCYAEALSKRYGHELWGNDVPRMRIKSAFANLMKIQITAEIRDDIRSVFVGSMMDIFERPMPLVDRNGDKLSYNTGALRDALFQNISYGLYPNIRFLFLTKRPSNIKKFIPSQWKINPPDNVFYGTSSVDQKTYDTLVPQLLDVNGKRFLSIEPQLGQITLPSDAHEGISWIIQGGESGDNKRPFNLDWAYSMRDQCKNMGLPYFFKQIDGKADIPLQLRVRQYPAELIGKSRNRTNTGNTASVKALF